MWPDKKEKKAVQKYRMDDEGCLKALSIDDETYKSVRCCQVGFRDCSYLCSAFEIEEEGNIYLHCCDRTFVLGEQ